MCHYFLKKVDSIKDYERKLALWNLLSSNVVSNKRKRKQINRAGYIFRKFHIYQYFQKYRRNVNLEIQIREKSNIQGAYLLLKRYKNRLKAFDEALCKMNLSKVDLADFNALKMSVKQERTITVYEDMQKLLDSKMNQIDQTIQRDRDEFRRLLHQT